MTSINHIINPSPPAAMCTFSPCAKLGTSVRSPRTNERTHARTRDDGDDGDETKSKQENRSTRICDLVIRRSYRRVRGAMSREVSINLLRVDLNPRPSRPLRHTRTRSTMSSTRDDENDENEDDRDRERKRARSSAAADALSSFAPHSACAREPLTFACWNADGLLSRVRAHKTDDPKKVPRTKTALVEMMYRERPDVIALQEVWLKCAGGAGKGKGGKAEPWCVYARARVCVCARSRARACARAWTDET